MSGEETKSHKRPRREPAIQCPENDSWILISQGAEARVWKVPNQQKDANNKQPFVIVKERFSKAYRHPILDERLTRQRCRMEGRVLEKCGKQASLQNHVPKVLKVDSPLLFLEYIEGKTVKQFINEQTAAASSQQGDADDVLTRIATEMGRLIGTLHSQSFVHGDLTTSNLLLVSSLDDKDTATTTSNNKTSERSPAPFRLYLIDFGLAKPLNQQKQGKNGNNIGQANMEEKAVDLYVLERALQSTHPQLPSSFWSTLETNYIMATDPTQPQKGANVVVKNHPTLVRLEQVRQRGRKRECFG